MRDVPEEASDDVLKKARRLRLNKLSHHVTQDCANCIKALVGGTNVVKPIVVEQDFLNNEDSNGFAKFRAGLHDTQAQRNDLCCQEEVDDLGRIVLHKCTNNTKTGQAKIFEGSRLGGGVEKGVEKQRDVCYTSVSYVRDQCEPTYTHH
jgi:hypothetical protein